MNKQLEYDVVIVGAGIVGLTLACHLINQGLRLAIVDKSENSKAFLAERNSISALNSNLRVSAITMGSQQIFENCQVWQKLAEDGLSSFQSMEVWEQASLSRLSFDAAEIGQAHLGTIVNNYNLHSALASQAKTARELDWFAPDSLATVKNEDSDIILSFTSGKSVTTQLLVGSDGVQSGVRHLAGIQSRERDYQQQAIVATVQTERMHEQIARQIFLPTGPLAFLPLTNPQHSSIVWSTTLEEYEKLKALTEEAFCLVLSEAFEHRLGRVEWTSKRLSFPLKALQSEQYIKPGITLIGDAANTIHPLAGQGANLGIADAVCLAKVILEAQQKQRSIGALHTLRRYERARRFHHRLMGGGVDLIQQFFATNNLFLANTRHFGVGLIEKIPWLKYHFVRYAMGNPQFR